MTFIPTIESKKINKTGVLFDIQNYHRRVKLAAYFSKGKKQEPPRFTPTSVWTPPIDKLPPEIMALIRQDNKDFQRHFHTRRDKGNLLQRELQALTELKRNTHIVIKPADKGSTVVILSRDQYVFEAERQLDDTTYYKKLTDPIYLDTVPRVHQIIDQLGEKGFINQKQKQYLKGEVEPRTRRFYILPKIHKDPEKWTVPFKVPPGRPIVSDCGSETYQTAEYIDYFLNPLSTKHPSFIKDTYHFISIIKNLKIPVNSSFFTVDIDSLYTNIDTKAGLQAVKKVFRQYPQENRPDQELLELLEINLTKNDFEFDSKYYLQIKGVAMGKKFAPSYANIFMADWEEKALGKCQKKPLLYLRYLDDIFGIWTHSHSEFENFITILDTYDPSIRLKYKFDEQSVDFLDTTVYKGQQFNDTGKLDIKVYFKETDTHSLLFKTSWHPKHTYKGLVKSQLIRFKRICTQKLDFKKAVKILFTALRKRCYSRTFLRQCLRSFQDRKPKRVGQIIPLITTYSLGSAILNNKLKNNYRSIIEQQGLLKTHQVISAYRRNKSLSDHLVRAKLQLIQPPHKTKVMSDFFVKMEYIQNKSNKTIFRISQTFKPETLNCVYLIFCSQCNMQYVGETKNSISTRLIQHRYNVRNKKETHTPIVQHFMGHGLDCLKVAGIQSNSSWTEAERRKAERKWINLLGTRVPRGLNYK